MLNFNKIDKDYILSKISQIELFSYYLPISISDIQDCLYKNKLICSPLRTDKNPTCGFYSDSKGKIRFSDFAGFFHGDCFDVVAYHKNLNASSSRDFNIILESIAIDFKLIQGGILTNTVNVLNTNIYKKKKAVIQVQPREWTVTDIYYFNKGGITTHTLDKMGVYPVYIAWINEEILYSFSFRDPCYAIRVGFYDGIDNWKLYFPTRESHRFITNNRYMMSMNLISKANFGIITKSFKDVAVFRQMGIQAIAVAGESIYPYLKEIEYIKSMWTHVFVLMDFDYTGIKMTKYLNKKYNFKYFFFTNGKFNTFNYEVKDAFEFTCMYDLNTLIELVKYIIENKNTNTSDYYDFLNYLLK